MLSAIVCGVDEAGRGPLAGPVYAAAVVLNPARPIQGLADSKALSSTQRERLKVQIEAHALAYCVARCTAEEIDRINILQASLLAMRRAVEGLALTPALALVDGNKAPALNCSVKTIIAGDASEPAISAASILAKCARDAWCQDLHARFPQYGFDRHKGYPTKQHLLALNEYGVCAEHRRSYGPVKRALGLI